MYVITMYLCCIFVVLVHRVIESWRGDRDESQREGDRAGLVFMGTGMWGEGGWRMEDGGWRSREGQVCEGTRSLVPTLKRFSETPIQFNVWEFNMQTRAGLCLFNKKIHNLLGPGSRH